MEAMFSPRPMSVRTVEQPVTRAFDGGFQTVYTSDVLEREMRQVQLDLKDDVQRCAQQALQAATQQENERLREESFRLRGMLVNLESIQRTHFLQLEQELVRTRGENTQLGDSNVGLTQSFLQLEKQLTDRELQTERQLADNEVSIAAARKQAYVEVEEVRGQLARLLSSQEELLINNASLKEAGSLREDAIRSLQEQLEREREKVRMLQTDFEETHDLQRKFDAVVAERDRLISDAMRSQGLEEQLASLRIMQSDYEKAIEGLQIEKASVQRLQAEIDSLRAEERRERSDVTEALQIAERTEEDLAAVRAELEQVRQRASAAAIGEAQALSDLQHLKNAEAERAKANASLRRSLEIERSEVKALKAQANGEYSTLELEMDLNTFVKDAMSTLNVDASLYDGGSQSSMAGLRLVFNEQAQQIQRLQSDLEAAQRSVPTRRLSQVEEIGNLRRQLQVLEAERNDLQREVKLNTGNRNSVIEVVDLRKQVQNLQDELLRFGGNPAERSRLLVELNEQATSISGLSTGMEEGPHFVVDLVDDEDVCEVIETSVKTQSSTWKSWSTGEPRLSEGMARY